MLTKLDDMVHFQKRVYFKDEKRSSFDCKIIIFVLFVLIVLKYSFQIKETQYVILSTGEKYKYVSMIKTLLNNQGVANNNVHVFLDSDHWLDIDNVHQYTITPNKIANGHERLTNNYKYVFDTMFKNGHEFIVVLEDDIFPAVDAVKYFEWGRRVMELDTTIFAVSGSNDNSLDSLNGKKSDVVIRGEQFVGLGWMTSANVYRKVLSTYLELCPTQMAWDQCTNQALVENNMVTLFPMVQRTLHVPYEKGTHKELVGLSFNLDTNTVFPDPYMLSNEYYRTYITDTVVPHATVTTMDVSYETNKKLWDSTVKRNTRDVPWPISFLAKKPFGFNQDIVVFPGKTKPSVFIFNKHNLRDEYRSLRLG